MILFPNIGGNFLAFIINLVQLGLYEAMAIISQLNAYLLNYDNLN